MKKEINIDNVLEGYVWLSDSQEPIVMPYDKLDKTRFLVSDNPFVVEAQYVDNSKVSHSIKYVDGHYYEMTTNPGDLNEDDFYLCETHRMKGRRMIVAQMWKPEEDKLCMGFDVLKFKGLVFVGFEK